MNKQIKVYSTLLIVAIGALVLSQIFSFGYYKSTTEIPSSEGELSFVDEIPGYTHTDTIEGGVTTTYGPVVSWKVHVKGKSHNVPMLQSKVGEQIYKVDMEEVSLSLPLNGFTTKLGTISLVTTVVTNLFKAALYIWLVWVLIRVLRKLRKGEVFTQQISRDLHITGILMAVGYVVALAGEYYSFTNCRDVISMAHHDMVFVSGTNSMNLIMGLVLMLISQVILLGKDMKEEQELTI